MRIASDREWRAQWISADVVGALPVFRRTFMLEKPAARATAWLCGLGQHELRLNGRKVGQDVLAPGWTNYAKTCLYVEHDVTQNLRAGENTIDVLLGNGMYNVPGGRYRKFKGSFGPPKLILELRVDFCDGSVTTIGTDESWRCAAGPITFSCIYGGEDYDARVAEPSAWQPVVLVDGRGGRLVAQTSPPVRVMESFKPLRVTEPRPGVRVFDLGQNFAGLPGLTARGPAGASLTLTTGELLDAEGLVNQKPTGSPVNFSYTLRGDASPETWQPRFSLTGFRYVQAEGDVASLLDVEGRFIYSSAKTVGTFECSPAIMFNFDVRSLYAKIARDMRDAQHENGMVPTIAPRYTTFKPPWDVFNDSPEWGSAAVINPWLVYQRYGDRAILEENHDVMSRYVEYLDTRADEHGILDYGLGDWYDIGPGDPGFCKLTSAALTATAVYFQDLAILQEVAALLGRRDDAERCTSRMRRVRSAFNAKLFDAAKGFYDRGSQTAQAMPLALGLVDEANRRAAVLDHLVRDIRAHDDHITAGDVGFRYVLVALAEAGWSDVIFDLLARTDPPSYGSQLARGATALTEAWDANPRSSQNHLMLGHAEAWFYEWLAGIQIDLSRPKGQQVVIRPAPVGDVTWTKARYDSALGRISIAWERDGKRLKLSLSSPVETKVHLPDGTVQNASPGDSAHECFAGTSA